MPGFNVLVHLWRLWDLHQRPVGSSSRSHKGALGEVRSVGGARSPICEEFQRFRQPTV